ncbi:TetR/AcrR family transcriptional regulator [Promicromonospora sp. NPDC019610]|uniref:TetR/AcrR family transcriptional regulator n=1 Tax=Promicromonospora sp. NPDC019610 TaxID=3364405 RepID=UPI0037AE873F
MTASPSTRGAARTAAIMQATLDLARENGYASLSIEAVAARAGVGKNTIYRRWVSKGELFLDSLLSQNAPALEFADTGDLLADLLRQAYAVTDLLANGTWGPLYRALVAEAQHDPAVAAGLDERFIRPQTERTVARVKLGQEQGQVSPDLDLDLAMTILSGPLYYRLLISREPVSRAFIDSVFATLFAGLSPRERP